MYRIERTLPIDIEHFFDASTNLAFCFLKFRRVGGRSLANLTGQVIWQRVWQNEITISQPLHKRAGSEPVSAVIGKICFDDDKQTGHVAHQIIIDPENANGVVDSRVNSIRYFNVLYFGYLLFIT